MAASVSLQCRCVAFTDSDEARRALHSNPADQPFPITRLCHKRSVQNDKTNPNPCSILGWDKHSYGYHGDDGHSFCSSGTGQPYGPTFTTGDVIGCCVNLINNTCFYTKNGISLGASACQCATFLNRRPSAVTVTNTNSSLMFSFDMSCLFLSSRRCLHRPSCKYKYSFFFFCIFFF